jgi:hypothetical protein
VATGERDEEAEEWADRARPALAMTTTLNSAPPGSIEIYREYISIYIMG